MDNLDERMNEMISNPESIRLSSDLIRQVELYLPQMEPGSTFLDAGCHMGFMYHLLIEQKNLDIKYVGIDCVKELVIFANSRFGPHFYYVDIMDYHTKHDYVWCSQMTQDDNRPMFRHLAGLANKKFIYTHIKPELNHENIINAVDVKDDGRFKVYIS